MKTMIFAALTVLSLAACSGPTINGQNDTVRICGQNPLSCQWVPKVAFDHTANSLG
jgi:hypothetical protein